MPAYQKAAEWGDRIPIGIIYRADKPTYEEKSGIAKHPPLAEARIEDIDISGIFKEFI